MFERSNPRLNRDLAAWIDSEHTRRRTRQALLASIVVTAALYLIPFGNLVAYPLMLLSTLVHELGHGMAAIAVGGHFDKLSIFANGSGVAHSHGVGAGAAQAIVAGGGLVGPAILAAVAFAFARKPGAARGFVGMLALAFAIMLALFVRNPFGIVLTGAFAVGLGFIAARCSTGASQLALVFLAVQLSLSVFSRGDYLFTDVAHTGAGVMPSDTAQMASALGGTYWAWGLACGAFSVLVLLLGASFFLHVLEPTKLVKKS